MIQKNFLQSPDIDLGIQLRLIENFLCYLRINQRNFNKESAYSVVDLISFWIIL